MRHVVMRNVPGVLVAAALALALGALSRLPYETERGDESVIRLSWRALGARVEECRPLTESERARLPAHMQREEVCEGRIVPYRLMVWLDGEPVVGRTVRAAGARGDRPLYVNEELRLEPGDYRLIVSFVPEDTAALADLDKTTAAPPLELDVVVDLSAREIAVVTYDADRRILAIKRPGP